MSVHLCWKPFEMCLENKGYIQKSLNDMHFHFKLFYIRVPFAWNASLIFCIYMNPNFRQYKCIQSCLILSETAEEGKMMNKFVFFAVIFNMIFIRGILFVAHNIMFLLVFSPQWIYKLDLVQIKLRVIRYIMYHYSQPF